MNLLEWQILWYGGVGALGAFASQLVYWSNVLVRGRKFRPARLMVSLLYVLVGGGIGAVAGDSLSDSLLVLGVAALWPDLLKAMRDTFETVVRARIRYLSEADERQTCFC